MIVYRHSKEVCDESDATRVSFAPPKDTPRPAAICLAFACGNALAQDTKTVVANAQKALGDVKSVTWKAVGK